MAESEEQVDLPEHVDEEDEGGYQPPAPKSLDEIMKTDAEDESLVKYKQQLLGGGTEEKIFFPEDPRQVIIRKMSIKVEGRPDLELDLSEPDKIDKNMKFVVKEGTKYKIMLSFHVQRDIVAGLRFENPVYRKSIKVAKEKYMVGSYGPKKEVQTWVSPEEEFPSGLMARGSYHAKSLFTDDDKNEILKWEWKFDIKKDWE